MMEGLKEEICDYKIAFENERKNRMILEEQLDDMALENMKLKQEIIHLKTLISSNKKETDINKDLNDLNISSNTDEFIIIPIEKELVINTPKQRINNACNGKNVLCCSFLTLQNENKTIVLLTGGADSCLSAFDSIIGLKLFQVQLLAPLLSIDTIDNHVVAGLMDGSIAYMSFRDSSMSPEHKVLKCHSKYVIRVKFCENFCATASYDGSVNLFLTRDNDGILELEEIKKFLFPTTPECITFLNPLNNPTNNTAQNPELVVGLRGVHYLIYINLKTLNTREISLNEKDWDTHVSFTPLYLCPSPDHKKLIIATDNNLHIVVIAGTNKRIKVLAGHSAGEYSKPVVVWGFYPKRTGFNSNYVDSNYIYSNSDEGNGVIVYSLVSGKIENRILGHSGLIKDLCLVPDGKNGFYLITASHDKSLGIWHHS